MFQAFFWACFILIIYTYFIYPAFLYLFYRSPLKKKEASSDYRWPKVSLVVAAYNEEKVIAKKIENSLDLDYPEDRLEIIISSDGSTDNTDTIAEKYVSHGITFLKFNSRRGKVNVLNDVIPKAKGEVVLLSDANTIYKGDAVKKIVRDFADPEVGCVCGELIFRNVEKNEVGALEGFYWRYEQFIKKIEGANGALLGANGGIYAIRKGLFEILPSNVIIEDFVIPMRILEKGYDVIYESAAVAFEETSKKVIQEMERRIRIGAGDFQSLLLTWKLLNPSRGFAAFAYLSHKVIRWLVPFFLISLFFINIFLIQERFYFVTFLLQSGFYSAAILGRILSRTNLRLKFFGLPYYFISMNIALFFGFIRFCANSQSVTWQKTER